MQTILPFLQTRQDEMLELLRVFVEYESHSRDKASNDRLAQVLATRFETLTGGKAQILPHAQSGNQVRGEWNFGDADAPQILLLGHFDTVWQPGTLGRMPFRVEDGKAFGPGTFDMKAGLVQGFFALRALSQLGRKIGYRVVFLMTSDEEIGSSNSRELIEAEAAKSHCVLVLEPAAGEKGALKTSRKGSAGFEMNIEGITAHAGLDPEKGRSAIEELARQIIYLHGLTDFKRGITLNVGVVEGGTASNVVAGHASAQIDLRIHTQADAAEIVPLIVEAKPFLDGTRVSIEGGLSRPPMGRTEAAAKLYELAKRIARDEMNFELAEIGVGGGSDGNFTAPLAPTLDGLGPVGDGAHAAHEHVVITEMPRRSALLARLIEDICKS